MTGKITGLVQDRGFGFIMGEDGTEYFFHMNAVRDAQFYEFAVDDPVTFEAVKTPKGFRADAVRLVR